MLKEKYDKTPVINVILGDFFEHTGQYDLIIEQTFFCAIDPKLREKYVAQSSALLKPSGKIIGVLTPAFIARITGSVNKPAWPDTPIPTSAW